MPPFGPLYLATSLLAIILQARQDSASSNSDAQPVYGCDVEGAVDTTSGVVLGHEAPHAPGVGEYLGIPFAEAPVGRLRFGVPIRFSSGFGSCAGHANPIDETVTCGKSQEQDESQEQEHLKDPDTNQSQIRNQDRNKNYTQNKKVKTIKGDKFAPMCPQAPSLALEGYNLSSSAYKIVSDLFGSGLEVSEDCLYLNVWSRFVPCPSSSNSTSNLTTNSTSNEQQKQRKPVLVWIHGGSFDTGGTAIGVYNGKYVAQTEDVVVVSIAYRVNVFGFAPGETLVKNVGLLDQRVAVEWIRDNIASFGGDPKKITLFGQSSGGSSVDLYNFAWRNDPIIHGSIIESGTALSFGNFRAETVLPTWYALAGKLGCEGLKGGEVVECLRSPRISAGMITAALGKLNGSGPLGTHFGPMVDGRTVFENYSDMAERGLFSSLPILVGNNNDESGLFMVYANRTDKQWFENDQQEYFCPSNAAARQRRDAGLKAWRYVYSASFDELVLPTTDLSEAYHTAELPVLFGTSEDVTGVVVSEGEKRLGGYLRRAWASFARDPDSGLEGLGMPVFDAQRPTLVLLGVDGRDGFETVEAGVFDKLCTYPWIGTPNV